jgi:hypothetical protein
MNGKPLKQPQQQPGLLELMRCFAERSVHDLIFTPQTIYLPQQHLDAAMQWLKLAHDRSPDDGVSWGFSLRGAWRTSYPETSGYIAETFFDLAKYVQDEDAWQRAISISHWLIRIQAPDGSIANTRYGTGGIVFDTGQVLQGLVRAYVETQKEEFLAAATAAADWLVRVADHEGRWTRQTYNGIPHVYNSRVAWILLCLHQLNPSPERARVALANLDWAVTQQEGGWFKQCAFVANAAPFTHTIAYAIRGLLEAGWLLKNQQYLEAAIAGAQVVMARMSADGFLPGQIDTDGLPIGRYCCLTGNCQMAIIWLKLFQHTGDSNYSQAARQSLQYVMARQNIQTTNLNIRGGIKGSHPIWGRYVRLSYPNWATKFFTDALLLYTRLNPT